MYPVFGVRGASWLCGAANGPSVHSCLRFWDKRLGVLGAAGSVVTFTITVAIIPFMPDGWAASAGGFPAMTGNIPVPNEGRRIVGSLDLSSEAGPHSHRSAMIR
jgi:hypothetical protein